MATAVNNTQRSNNVECSMPFSLINEQFKGTANPAEVSAFLVSLAESLKEAKEEHYTNIRFVIYPYLAKKIQQRHSAIPHKFTLLSRKIKKRLNFAGSAIFFFN